MASLAIYCTSSSKGGLELNLLRLASWLSESHQVSVWFVTGTPLFELAKEKGLNLNAISLPNKYFDFVEARELAKRLNDSGIDVVISSLNRDIDILCWAKTLSKKGYKLIYFQQMLFPVSKKSLLHNYRFSKIDAWLSPCDFLMNQVKNNTNIPYRKFIKVPLGIETAAFVTAKNHKTEIKSEWGLSPDKNYIGLLGRTDPMKGQALLIEAFGIIKNKHPNWDLLLVGESSLHLKTDAYSQRVSDEIKKQNLQERVRFLPFTSQPYKFYSVADVFVLGSHEEAYGMVTIEALVSGTPVIGSDTGSTPELLGFGEYGFLYKAKDAKSMAAKLEEALSGFEAVSIKAMAQRSALASAYSHEKEIEQIEMLLNKWGL